jgi:hypothetical protein
MRAQWIPRFAFFILTILLLPQVLVSQQVIQNYSLKPSVGLEVSKVKFEHESKLAAMTSAWFLSMQYPVGEHVAVVAELPFSYLKVSGHDDSENTFGNPFLGLHLQTHNPMVSALIGVRLSAVSDDKVSARSYGYYSDLRRLDAFFDNLIPIHASFLFYNHAPNGTLVQINAGGSLFLYQNTPAGGKKSDFLLNYSIQFGYKSDQGSVLAGLFGKMNVTGEHMDISQRTIHQFTLQASARLNQYEPGFQILFPLDKEYSEYIKFTYGLLLMVHFE